MKKSLFFAASLALLASCASDELVDTSVPNAGGVDQTPIRFETSQKNITRATLLQNAGHYNFGVFAYKSTDATNNIMANYLVGYMDDTNKKGYYMTVSNQTTLGDVPGAVNGASMWAYEMLGSSEYSYTGSEGYYTKNQTEYMSNVSNQYLRYWDKSAATTTFYAYAPYINGGGTATYTNNDHILTIPNGSMVATMVHDNTVPEGSEFMVAATEVAMADYGKDVPLSFKRLNAKVNIKFWEDIPGYSVKLIDLTADYGVSAAPAIAGTPNTLGEYYKSSGVAVDFSNVAAPTITQSAAAATTQEALNFHVPTALQIGTTRVEASPSPSTYYAIPKSNDTGFTFHVSYELTSTTGERIVVRNATAYVPFDYTNWAMNTHYTYIFKITKDSNGTTGDPGTIDPNDPTIDPEAALYPIIFDNCTVEDWVENVSGDYIISDGNTTPGNPVSTETKNYSVVLDKSVVLTSGDDSDRTVTAQLYKDADVATTVPAGSWSVSGGLTISADGKVVVPTTATPGDYTITYELSSVAGVNYPKTYTATFTVIGSYGVSVSTANIATNGEDATTLDVRTTVNGVAEATPAGTFSIVYPDGTPADKKNAVTVDKETKKVTVGTNAYPGAYKVVYTTAEGTCDAAFTVIDLSFKLSSGSVGLDANGSSVSYTTVASAPSGANVQVKITNASGTVASGITLGSGVFNVDSTVAPGLYTITKTANLGGSVTVYKQVLEVKNVYTLSIDKSVVDNDNAPVITVTATKNGVSNVADVDYSGISGVTGITVNPTAGAITIGSDCASGNYTIKNGDKTATFEVQD